MCCAISSVFHMLLGGSVSRTPSNAATFGIPDAYCAGCSSITGWLMGICSKMSAMSLYQEYEWIWISSMRVWDVKLPHQHVQGRRHLENGPGVPRTSSLSLSPQWTAESPPYCMPTTSNGTLAMVLESGSVSTLLSKSNIERAHAQVRPGLVANYNKSCLRICVMTLGLPQ